MHNVYCCVGSLEIFRKSEPTIIVCLLLCRQFRKDIDTVVTTLEGLLLCRQFRNHKADKQIQD